MRGDRFFELNGTTPKFFEVVDLTPPGHATKLYGVQAEYGWARRIIAMGCFVRDANDIACVLGGRLGVPFNQAPEPAPLLARHARHARPSVDD